MSLESLKLFLKSNKSDQQNPFGKVDPYNTFTFKFTKRPENVDIFDSLYGEDLHKYIKQLTLPNASINGEQINIPGVQFATHRLMPMGDSGSTIKVEFLNTTKPILESIMFEWMKAYTINANDFPEKFKSNIEVGFTHSSPSSPMFDEVLMHESGKADRRNFNSVIDSYVYNYYGVRPVEMATLNPSNEPMTEFYRSVTFAYDYFWITKNISI